VSVAYLSRRLAYDLDQLREAKLEELVGLKVLARSAPAELDRLLGSLAPWRTRTWSGGVIQRCCPCSDLVPEVPAEVLVGSQLNLPAPEEPGELELHGREADESGGATGLELDQEVDVAIGPVLSPACRAEQRQAPNAVFPAEAGESLAIDAQYCVHGPIFASVGGVKPPPARDSCV